MSESDGLAFDPGDLWYIQLADFDSKFPADKWGGYSQSYVASDDVYTHQQVVDSEHDNWGVVGCQDFDHGTLTTLVFDLDVHKAPEEFDPERVSVPDDTLLVRSQNGGLHVYFKAHVDRGELAESDFEMTDDLGWDIDIRGSAVSMHVVAPGDIPGVDSPYEVVNDEDISAVMDPADAAERVRIDGEPLLEFNPGGRIGSGVDIDRDVEPPDEMPTCYHRGLQLRHANPDEHPNTHKVNVLTALCGLSAGYDVESVVAHFCDDYPPGKDVDRESTDYHLRHIADHIDRGDYSPPAVSTLRDFGILDDNEGCQCEIAYHGSDPDSPDLDVTQDMRDGADEAAAVATPDGAEPAETDGGVAADPGGGGGGSGRDLRERVIGIIKEAQNDEIPLKTARHRIAVQMIQEFDFVKPEREVRGWREVLYVYNEDEGVYEPRGEAFVEKKLERLASDFVTNQIRHEVFNKIERMSIARGGRFETDPHRLVVGNGILDLHTGELEPYSPKELHRTKIGVDWNPDAGEPDAIDDWLHDIVRDKDVPTMFRLISHTLYQEYIGEKAAMLVGGGQNGKSVFLDFVERFLGQSNTTHRALQDFDDNDFAANQLQGKLANIHPDMGDQDVKDMSTFKKLTGRDTMLADVKFEAPIEFENFASLLFAANSIPVFAEDTHAIWRRWVYVDFPYEFRADKASAKDPEPKRKVLRRLTTDEQMEALLLRCQREIQEWHQGRDFFADAMAPEDVRDKMKKAAEPVYNFAAACLEADTDEDAYLPKDAVRSAYRQYADEEDLPRIPENQFGERLMRLRDFQIEHSQRRVDGARKRVYQNIQFTSRGRQILGLDEDDENQTAESYAQSKPKVMDIASDLVSDNGNEPVSRDMILGRAMSQMGRASAERAIDALLEQGDLMDTGDGLLPT